MPGKVIGIAVYFAVVAGLGWLGWRRTSGAAEDFSLAKRQAGPFLVGLSYGATFVSTSAIIGFGGVAAQFGTQLLWLYAMNLFVSVILAISVLGLRARRLAAELDCQTFPELMARRFDSPGVGRFVAAVILLFTPVYGAAVLIGISRVMEVALGAPFAISIVLVLVSTGIYVVAGGFRAVLYTDSFQALAMAVLLPVGVSAGSRSRSSRAAGPLTSIRRSSRSRPRSWRPGSLAAGGSVPDSWENS